MKVATRWCMRMGAMLVAVGLSPWGMARAGTDVEPISRLEMFTGVGVSATIARDAVSPTEGWPTLQLGAGYRMGRSISLGALVGLDLLGQQDITYAISRSQDIGFTSSVTGTMVPVCAYVAARLPSYQGARWFVSAQGGAYICQTHADRPDAPDLGGTLPTFGVSLGLSGDEQRFAPRVELGYEMRSSSAGGWFPEGWVQAVTLKVGLRAQR